MFKRKLEKCYSQCFKDWTYFPPQRFKPIVSNETVTTYAYSLLLDWTTADGPLLSFSPDWGVFLPHKSWFVSLWSCTFELSCTWTNPTFRAPVEHPPGDVALWPLRTLSKHHRSPANLPVRSFSSRISLLAQASSLMSCPSSSPLASQRSHWKRNVLSVAESVTSMYSKCQPGAIPLQ